MTDSDQPLSGAGSDLLTSTQAGQIIGKSGRTVVRMAEKGLVRTAGKLPGDNGAFLFRRSDIEALLNTEASA